MYLLTFVITCKVSRALNCPLPVADPGVTNRQGVPTPEIGMPSYYLAIFFYRKVHQNNKSEKGANDCIFVSSWSSFLFVRIIKLDISSTYVQLVLLSKFWSYQLPDPDIKLWYLRYTNKPVAGFRGAPPARALPYSPKCSQFHAVFRKFWQNHMLAPPWRVGAPSYGESWIRPCKHTGHRNKFHCRWSRLW